MQRQLAEISYEYVGQIITKPEPSKVFKILAKATRFEKELRKASENLKMPDGTETKITRIYRLFDALSFFTRYAANYSKGIETIEKLLLEALCKIFTHLGT